MAEGDEQRKRHFVLERNAESEQFRSRQQWGHQPTIPDRDRRSHGGGLLQQLEALRGRHGGRLRSANRV